jgi:hypothetical protein
MGASDTPFYHTMRMLIKCCHGEVMWQNQSSVRTSVHCARARAHASIEVINKTSIKDRISIATSNNKLTGISKQKLFIDI